MDVGEDPRESSGVCWWLDYFAAGNGKVGKKCLWAARCELCINPIKIELTHKWPSLVLSSNIKSELTVNSFAHVFLGKCILVVDQWLKNSKVFQVHHWLQFTWTQICTKLELTDRILGGSWLSYMRYLIVALSAGKYLILSGDNIFPQIPGDFYLLPHPRTLTQKLWNKHEILVWSRDRVSLLLSATTGEVVWLEFWPLSSANS